VYGKEIKGAKKRMKTKRSKTKRHPLGGKERDKLDLVPGKRETRQKESVEKQ